MRLIKLFELELSSRKIAAQLGLKGVNIIRIAIIAHNKEGGGLLCGEIEMDGVYFGGKRKGKRGRGVAGKIPVFGILERNGVVRGRALKRVTAESIRFKVSWYLQGEVSTVLGERPHPL